MDILGKASAALQRCEQELRDLGAQALKEGNYDSARRIAELAETLTDNQARRDMLGIPAKALPRKSSAQSSDKAVNCVMPSDEHGTRAASRRKRSTAADYPRFQRRGEKLVKVGWSKKNKQEYQHNAPWPAVSAFAAHLRTQVRNGRIFNVESLIPIDDPDGRGELPTYQIYLTLAWFRSVGLVEKRGRDGYIANRQGLSDEALGQHWLALPTEKV